MLVSLLLTSSAPGAIAVTSPATVDELTAMATTQARATWQKVEVRNERYAVTVRPISKTLAPGCTLFHHVIRKDGNIIRDHTLRICGANDR